jgi:two-component sensor histidine kinase
MRMRNAGRNSKETYAIDFALVPVAIVLIEISVFFTQLSKEIENNLSGLITLRIIHTIIMLLIAYVVSLTYKNLQLTQVTYSNLAMTGIAVIALGDLTHAYLASIFEIELVSIYRRIGITLIQGSLWFPAFVFIGGNRKEIFRQFREYENRLIIATRAQSRTSQEFKEIQKELQDRIREEFRDSCKLIKESIAKITTSGDNLADQYGAIKLHLVGDSLRTLSRNLDNLTSDSPAQRALQKNLTFIPLFLRQFRIISTSILQSKPLHRRTYAFVLLALVTPPYINFYSITEFLISYPILVVAVFIFSHLIVKTQSEHSLSTFRNSAFLILLTGLLPFVFNSVGQAIYHDPQTQFPIYITALILPLTYFLTMELLQVLRPSALNLIRRDELKASETLQNKVRDVVRDEFSQNLSHEWALFIHGKILTRLAATSLKLGAAASTDDRETFNETVKNLQSLLVNPDLGFDEESVDLQSEVASRLDPWRGLLGVTLMIDDEIATIRNSRVRDIGQVIEELISNSIRHGRSGKIDLKLMRAGNGQIEITAVDDATIPPPESISKYGLGTRIFNLASDGRWSITRVGSSTVFNLRMSIEK